MVLFYLLPSCVDEKKFAFRPTPFLLEKKEVLWENSLIPLSNIKLTTEQAYRNLYFVFFDTFFFDERGIKHKDRLCKKKEKQTTDRYSVSQKSSPLSRNRVLSDVSKQNCNAQVTLLFNASFLIFLSFMQNLFKSMKMLVPMENNTFHIPYFTKILVA